MHTLDVNLTFNHITFFLLLIITILFLFFNSGGGSGIDPGNIVAGTMKNGLVDSTEKVILSREGINLCWSNLVVTGFPPMTAPSIGLNCSTAFFK